MIIGILTFLSIIAVTEIALGNPLVGIVSILIIIRICTKLTETAKQHKATTNRSS